MRTTSQYTPTASAPLLGGPAAPVYVQSALPARPGPIADQIQLSPSQRATASAQRYAALAGSDAPLAEKMSGFRAVFDPRATFEGPVFGRLGHDQMFGKLGIEHTGGAKIQYADVGPSDVRRMSTDEIAKIDPQAAARGARWHEAKLSWKADYSLGKNAIHNEVTTTLAIGEDGKVRKHTDAFDWKAWMDQAVPFVPRFVRHSEIFRRVANFGLGIVTHLES